MDIFVEIGMSATCYDVVTEKNIAPTVKSGSLPVYATPSMIALIEKTACEAIKDVVKSPWTSVGVRVDVQHLSATLLGMKVHALARVISVEGRKIIFEAEVYDETTKIGTGTHERFLVEEEKFMKKLGSKL